MKRRLRMLHLFTEAIGPPWNWGDDPTSRLLWPGSALFEFLDRERFELVIGTLKPPPRHAADLPGLQLISLDAPGRKAYPQALAKLVDWLRRERIDIVQTHLFDASVVGLLAARLAGTPVIVATGHHSHEFAVTPPSVSGVIDCLCTAGLAKNYIVPSQFMRDTMLATYRMQPARVSVVPHGLDARRLTSSPGARARIRRELGLEDRVVLGAIGRLYWIKQNENLLRAFAAIAPRRPDAVLVICGDGGQRDELVALAGRLGIAERVKFLGIRGDATDVLTAIDLFVHPALTESFGLAIVEAMAAGKPVVSTAVGIAPEVIVDGETGMLVSPRDPDALARALATMLGVHDRWPGMGARAAEVARPFTAARMVAAYQDLYLKWFAESGGGAAG